MIPHGTSGYDHWGVLPDSTLIRAKGRRLTGSKRSADDRDTLARLCARLYYEERLTAEVICTQLKADGHDVRGVRDVRSLIDRALTARLVRVRVEHSGKAPAIDPNLGNELAVAAGLRKAVVITSSLAGDDGWASPDPARRMQAFRDADQLHVQLGGPAAQHLLDTLRTGDTVGIGPGRGTGSTMLALKSLVVGRPITVPDLRVFSLSGKVWIQAWDERGTSRDFLDSDDNALLFGRALGVKDENLKLAGLPLFIDATGETADNLIRTVTPHLLGDDWRAELGGRGPDLDVAVFGVGAVMSLGSHYAMCHRGPHAGVVKEIAELREVVEEIAQLRRESDAPEPPLAIVDIGDRFWLWSNAPETDLHRRAEEIVDCLNDKMVSVSFAKLQAGRERLVVAGGSQKYDGVLALLAKGRRIGVEATVLVTDEVTATRLLEDLPRMLDRTASSPDVRRPPSVLREDDVIPSPPWLTAVPR